MQFLTKCCLPSYIDKRAGEESNHHHIATYNNEDNDVDDGGGGGGGHSSVNGDDDDLQSSIDDEAFINAMRNYGWLVVSIFCSLISLIFCFVFTPPPPVSY